MCILSSLKNKWNICGVAVIIYHRFAGNSIVKNFIISSNKDHELTINFIRDYLSFTRLNLKFSGTSLMSMMLRVGLLNAEVVL